MKTQSKFYLLGLSLVFVLSGCVVRSYPVTRERVDQDLITGNRGYLLGQAPRQEAKERKTTRTTQVVEVELHSPIKFERMPKAKVAKETEAKTIGGGSITESTTPAPGVSLAKTEKYTVQKGDTLQKISQRFYGTTRKWNKIFQANQDRLRAPDKIYPGQVINVPIEPLKETRENLK